MRLHTLKIGAELRVQAAARSDPAAPSITVTLDSTFIRSCEDGERHLEVRIGNVETETGGRQVFGAVAKADTDIKVLIRRSLDAVGRTEDTALTAFTDGCSGLRRILADAGVTEAPALDWFHIAMRLQHLGVTTRAVPRFTLGWTNHEQHSFGRWCSCFPSSLRQAAAMKFSLATRSGRKVPLGWGSCIQS